MNFQSLLGEAPPTGLLDPPTSTPQNSPLRTHMFSSSLTSTAHSRLGADQTLPLQLFKPPHTSKCGFSSWKGFFPASIPKRCSLLTQSLERTLIPYSSWPAKLKNTWSSHTLLLLIQSYPALPKADPLHKIPWTKISSGEGCGREMANFIPSPYPRKQMEKL